jgi:hypothetical protein
VINDQLSSGGTTPSDSLIGYDTITPQDAAHEMTHAFGVCSHADRLQLDDYADPFCLMGMGNTARSFQNPRLTVPGNFTHATTGPGLCAPYLYVAGWLDYKANVIEIGSGSVDEHVGETISLAANQGAPPWVSLQTIAVTFGAVPQTPNDPPQFWVEYRKPDGFDRGIDKPVSSNIADWPVEGGIILHKVTFGSARCPSQLHSMVSNWQGAAPGAVLTIPGTGYGLEITSVDRPGQRVQLTIKHTYDPDSWFDEYLSEFLILLGGVEVGAGGWSLNPRTGKREPVPPRPILPRELVPAERDLAIAQIVNRLAGLLSDETARAALSETALGAARKAQEILAGN